MNGPSPAVIEAIVQDRVERLPPLNLSVGQAIVATHDRMQCHICERVVVLTSEDAAFYTRRGWPRCCSREMRLVAKEETP